MFLSWYQGKCIAYFWSGFDESEIQRKRQRTASPDRSSTVPSTSSEGHWADHLKTAAFGPCPDPGSAQQYTISARQLYGETPTRDIQEELEDRSGNYVERDKVTAASEDGFLAFISRKDVAEGQRRKPAMTPPKRMLRVRPDGKLGSPTVKPSVVNQRPKRAKKSMKSEAETRTLVVTIKSASDRYQPTLGQKIDDILCGVIRYSGSKKESPSKEPAPPRPTHPFFSGGVSRLTRHDPTTITNNQLAAHSNKQPLQQQIKPGSPRQARVTSKPANIPTRPAGTLTSRSNTFGADLARVSRFPGAMEPIWPPAGMLHIGRPAEVSELCVVGPNARISKERRRKMKAVPIAVGQEEDVLKPCRRIVQTYNSDRQILQKLNSREWREFRRPRRVLLTGREMQHIVRQRLTFVPNLGSVEEEETDISSSPRAFQRSAHKALQSAYQCIATSRTAFDRFECESQDWLQKHAPKCGDDVLQQSNDIGLFKDWLKSTTIRDSANHAVGEPRKCGSSSLYRKRIAKRRRRTVEGLDEFVISSEDELETANANSGVCERSTNAVVVCGPHGCGKTAAVYAVAQELGFEIFEINPGSRRSGRDVLDKVGDMTRNHLVKHDQAGDLAAASKEEEANSELLDIKLHDDIASGRQGTMRSFFMSKTSGKDKRRGKKPSPSEIDQRPKISNGLDSKPKSHKQSLILLEEVDVLFEDDKAFWTTTLELILQTKRPVIMTCSDETQLPLEDMVLHAIFRFVPPAEDLATDYLLLIACNEGHLLSRDAVAALYRAKGSDLRASIAELGFFCQMGIGDTKGGLEWMLIPPARYQRLDEKPQALRVVSDGTYQYGMGWLSGDSVVFDADQSLSSDTELLSEAWSGWGIDVEALRQDVTMQQRADVDDSPQRNNTELLRHFEQASEALSATDTLTAPAVRSLNDIKVDTSQPELTEKTRMGYTEGSILVQADPLFDHAGIADAIALTLRASSSRLLRYINKNTGICQSNEESVLHMISEAMRKRNVDEFVTKQFSALSAFDPIARHPNAVLGISKSPQITSFDGPSPPIFEDIAPYIRSIVSFDQRLEVQRHQLSSLLSQPGKDGGKTRTTRASRAALEGGSKSQTRRERWFSKSLDFNAVLRSGGEGWQDMLLQRAHCHAFGDGLADEGFYENSLDGAIDTIEDGS